MKIYCDDNFITEVKNKKEKRKILGSLLLGGTGNEVIEGTKIEGNLNFRIELGNPESF